MRRQTHNQHCTLFPPRGPKPLRLYSQNLQCRFHFEQLPDCSQQLALAFDQSPVFKAVTKEQELSASFKSEQVLYNGKVDKRLACHVLCWEADNSSEDFYAVVCQTLREEAEQLIEAAVTAAGADEA
jgi:hypothetical protein